MKHGAGGEINRVDSIDGRYKNKLADKHSNNVKTRAKIEYKAWKLEELKMRQASKRRRLLFLRGWRELSVYMDPSETRRG